MYKDGFFHKSLDGLVKTSWDAFLKLYGVPIRYYAQLPQQILDRDETNFSYAGDPHHVVEDAAGDFRGDYPSVKDPLADLYNDTPATGQDNYIVPEDEAMSTYSLTTGYFLPYKAKVYYKEGETTYKIIDKGAVYEERTLDIIISLKYTELIDYWNFYKKYFTNANSVEPPFNPDDPKISILNVIRVGDYIEVEPFGDLVEIQDLYSPELGRRSIIKLMGRRFYYVEDVIPIAQTTIQNNYVYKVKAKYERRINYVSLLPLKVQ